VGDVRGNAPEKGRRGRRGKWQKDAGRQTAVARSTIAHPNVVGADLASAGNAQITDDGLESLEDLQHLQTLKFFHADGVTDVSMNVLGKSLPNCEIGKYDASNGDGE